jgi:hypothetical protein
VQLVLDQLTGAHDHGQVRSIGCQQLDAFQGISINDDQIRMSPYDDTPELTLLL